MDLPRDEDVLDLIGEDTPLLETEEPYRIRCMDDEESLLGYSKHTPLLQDVDSIREEEELDFPLEEPRRPRTAWCYVWWTLCLLVAAAFITVSIKGWTDADDIEVGL
jgi:uncharacterized membrane protein YcjF (UPF0283 family)